MSSLRVKLLRRLAGATVMAALLSSAPAAVPRQMLLTGTASQSSDYDAAYPAANATDGDAATFSHTLDLVDSYWLLTLPAPAEIGRVELVNRADAGAERMQGLTLRILDAASNTVATATLTNPGLGGVWSYEPPALVTGQYVRVGLEDGATNGDGNHYVTLAEARVFSGRNLALGQDSFMTRLSDTLPPATNANDDSFSTTALTTTQTVDGYWEVDLGQTYAIYAVRAVSADEIGSRLTNAILRLYDEAHESVFSRHLQSAEQPDFKLDLGDVYRARYVRIGLENKQRTAAGVEWYIGFKEVQVFGRSAEEVGILDFRASSAVIVRGQSVTLSWQLGEMHQASLYPGIGPVDAQTDAAGRGSLVVAPTSSVCYLLVTTNACGIYEGAVTVTVDGQTPPLRIEEFVADNAGSLEDGYGDKPDWIELRNPGELAVNLAGYGLSDNLGKPLKWVFPAVTIPAHGRLIVFASGHEESVDPAGFLHADWKLSADGGNLVLSTPAGAAVDRVTGYPPQREDLAYARDLEGNWGFQDPTPGTLNRAARYDGWLAPPDFSHKRGFYQTPFALTITNMSPGSTLLISTNGADPAIPYIDPLPIPATRTVRAAVVRAGYKSPRTKTHTYVFLENTVTAAVMNTAITRDARFTTRIRDGLRELPTIVIAAPVVLDDYYERECSMEILWPGGDDTVQANCGMAQFGGSWQEFAKKSYRFNFRKDYGPGRLSAPLLNGFDHGVPARGSFNELELRSGSQDMNGRGFYMASTFVQDAMLDMGSLNPHSRYVHLYLNGTYWGQYELREPMDDHFLAGYLGGTKTNYLVVRGNDNFGDNFIVGTPDPLNRHSWERVRALGGSYRNVKSYLDVPNLLDFTLLWLYGNCESEYRSAGSVDAGSGFKFWMADSDGFLRTSAMGMNRTANAGPGGLVGMLRAEGDPDFKMLLADRIYRHFFNDGALTPAANTARLAARMGQVTNSLIAECARWNYRTPDNWNASADAIYTGLFPGRTTQLVAYLRSAQMYPPFDPPVCNQQGGAITNGFPLTFSAPSGTVYYTTDGSDPRLPGGAVDPGAAVFNTPGSTDALIAPGSAWRYWDLGGRADTTWREPGFDDTTWSNGIAELGYGDGGEMTVIGFGTNAASRYITSYFRQTFAVTNPAGITQLDLQLVRDDGAVVYLNGTEVVRDNMPAGTITADTPAAATISGVDELQWFTFVIPTNALRTGTNVLAVEVHQIAASSTDVSFNLGLTARRAAAEAPVVLAGNTVVKSRVWTGSAWSALNEASFYLAGREPATPDNVLITEVHYDSPGYADNEEFIEIMNVGSNEVDLSGASLTNAVDFVFPNGVIVPPGGFVLVVENPAAFAAAYQTPASPYYRPGLAVAGEWAGALANNSETVVLRASNGVEIASVPYASDGDWPTRAAGRGSSLELAAPLAIPAVQPARNEALARAINWQSSSLFKGSPGRLDPYNRDVVINEVLSHTDVDVDWIELHNRGTQLANLSERYLSDNWEQPLRYRIAADTELGPGQYLSFNLAQLGFGFSELGADALLVEASGTNVIRFLDTVDFPAVEREEPFGRHLRLDGVTDFTELRAVTRDATNTLPRVGPVVISEFMANPATNRVEYVELLNIGAAPVTLFDPNHAENAWELSGAVEFRFPASQSMAPGGIVIVCATNPAVFRQQYALDPSVPVYGPWTGRLNNAGDSLKLRRPGNPELDGTVPYYRVDRVAYRFAEPWPQTTQGVSWVRVPLEGYGNDPYHWRAAGPDEGPGAVAGNRSPVIELTGATQVDEGSPLQWTVRGSDPDQPWQTVTLSAPDLPAGAGFDSVSGLLTWTPGEADGPQVMAIRLCAADNSRQPAATTQTVWLTVNEVNQAPVLGPLADFSFPVNLALDRTLPARDDDLPAQSLHFTETGLPDGLTLDPLSGRITGAGAAEGSYPVTVVVTDDQTPPLTATNAFTLTVTQAFRMRIDRNPADQARISVPTIPGQRYRLEYCDELSLNDWQLLQDLPVAVDDEAHLLDAHPAGQRQRFYRVRWER